MISQFSSIVMGASVSSDGAGGYSPSAATFAAALGVSNFDILSFIPVTCLFPATTFYHKLLLSTLAPLGVITLFWLPAFKRRITGTRSTKAERTAANWSIFLLEFIVSSVSTVVVQTFSCDKFDDELFLRAELVLKCDGSDERKLYLTHAWFALFVYPISKPSHAWQHYIPSSTIAWLVNFSPSSPQVFLSSSS